MRHIRPDTRDASDADTSTWDNIGLNYVLFHEFAKEHVLYPAMRDVIATLVKGGSRIMDFGSGSAAFSIEYARRGCVVAAYDVNGAVGQWVRERYRHEPRFRVVGVGAHWREEIEHNSIDVLLCSLVLMTMDDKGKMIAAIRDWREVLKDDGAAIIAVTHPWTRTSEFPWRRNRLPHGFDALDKSYVGASYTVELSRGEKSLKFVDYHWRIEDYVEVLSQGGFVVEAVREPTKASSVEASSVEVELWNRQVTQPPFLILVCRKNRDDFRRAIQDDNAPPGIELLNRIRPSIGEMTAKPSDPG